MRGLAISNTICVNNSQCNTAIIKYRNDLDSYGYDYETDPSFYNQSRIGVSLANSKNPTKEKVYRQTNGVFRRGNTIIDKTLELTFDPYDEETRDALSVAVKHSEFFIDDKSLFSIDSIEWDANEFDEIQTGTVQVYVQGFNQTNIRC